MALLAEFVKQFIGAAVAPTETSPKSIKHHFDNWRQDVRQMEEKQRLLVDNYEQRYNQPRITIESARRQFEAQAGLLKEEKTQDDYYRFMDHRPVTKASNIFTKHILD